MRFSHSVFGEFNINHKDWLTNPGGTDRPGELKQTILRKLTFLLRSQTVTFTVLVFWIYFFVPSDASIYSTMAWCALGYQTHLKNTAPSFLLSPSP